MKLKLLICTLLLSGGLRASEIIPKPVKVARMSGSFTITPITRIICATPDTRPLAEYLRVYLPVQTVQEPAFFIREKGNIVLSIDPTSDLPAEGYRLSVYEEKINITAKDYGGLFNGIQSLLQLLPEQVYTKNTAGQSLTLDNVIVRDWPQMPYRGMHLDVARTFVSVEDVLRLLDNMSYHKLNKFHFHLTDDEGWRMEIKSHPELAEVGGYRGGDSPVRAIYGHWDGKYGGYYTQAEIRRIIDYAIKRNIEVIPEIDLPGHSRTIALLHPEILCGYEPDLTSSGGYDRRNVWCVAREENYALLEDIVREVAMLFPSEYIHIGGDEVLMGQWNRCPHCKALMREKGYQTGEELQEHFMLRVADILSRYGKKAAVWNEAIKGGKLPETVRVHCWEDVKACKKSAEAGYGSIIMPARYFYFDMRQSEQEPGHTWAAIFDTEDCYSFDFAELGLTEEKMKNVLGVEGAFWTELYLYNGHDFMDYQLFPRICALSEIAWTPQSQRSWQHFASRLEKHLPRLDAMGIKYRMEPQKQQRPEYVYPQAELTGSIPQSEKNPYSGAAEYKKQARTIRTCRKGDWFQFTFAEPQSCSSLEVVTGYDHLPRYIVEQGSVEVSSDGVNFERAAGLVGGRAKVECTQPVKAIRIVVERDGNGEDNVVVQPLKIFR